MKTAKELDIPVRSWVPGRLAVAAVFIIMLPIAMLNGTYTGSMVEVSNTLGVYTEDITIGYYAASRWQSAFSSALAQGHGADEAVQMATNTLNTILQQGTLLALKHILGWLFAVTLAIAIISRFIPFHKTVRVPVVRTGEDMV